MFFAINPKTNEKVNSLTIEENPSYQFIKEDTWYADPDEIESCPKEINIKKINVNFREGSSAISFKGNKYFISPHFYIPNQTTLGINTIPESKEHKEAKNWIYNKLKQKVLMINYSSINKPYKYHNQINLLNLPLDKSKIGIEIHSSKIGINSSRRADVICPFITKHPILGNGIVFEIQFSKQKQKTKISRELDWSIRGYSIAWLHRKDFNNITDSLMDLKKESVDVDSFANLIKQNNKTFVRELKFAVQEECRKLDEKLLEINIEKGKLDKKKEEIIKELLERLNVREAILFNKIKSLEGNPFQNLVERYKEEISEKGNTLLRELKELQEEFNPRVMPCKKCNQGYLVLKITTRRKKELYECQACNAVIWIK